MAVSSWVPLPGSERGPPLAAEPAGAADGTERIEVTLVTRRMAELPRTAAGAPARVSRDDLRQRYGTDPADQALVARVLGGPDTGVEVIGQDPAQRQVTVSGTLTALAKWMKTVPDKPAAASLKPNFSTRNVGVQVRKMVATKFAPTNASMSNGTDGVRKMT